MIGRARNAARITIVLGVLVATSTVGIGAFAQSDPPDHLLGDPRTAGMWVEFDGVAEMPQDLIDVAGELVERGSHWNRGWRNADGNTLAITAFTYDSGEDLRITLGATLMALDAYWEHPALDGVVGWTEDVEELGVAQYRMFAEGSTGYRLVTFGPNAGQVMDRALVAQLEVATGERIEITDDLETLAADALLPTPWYESVGVGAIWVVAFAGVVLAIRTLVRRRHLRSAKAAHRAEWAAAMTSMHRPNHVNPFAAAHALPNRPEGSGAEPRPDSSTSADQGR